MYIKAILLPLQISRLFKKEKYHLTPTWLRIILLLTKNYMSKQQINKLAVTIEKVNYLYRSVRKREENIQKLELALLKKYVTELYDGLLELELDLKKSASTAIINEIVEKAPLVKEKASSDEDLHSPLVQEVNKIAAEEEESSTELPELTIENDANEQEDAPANIQLSDTPVVYAPIASEDDEETEEEDDNATINMSGFTEDVKEETIDEAETSFLENFVPPTITDEADEEPDEEEIVVDGDGAIKTQVLENLGFVTEDAEEKEEPQTVAMDMNDYLARKQAESSEGTNGERMFSIGFNQRIAYIKELFDNDEAAYTKAINDLAASKGYIEALTYINLNLRYDYKWQDENPTVKEFLEMIKRKFLGKV